MVQEQMDPVAQSTFYMLFTHQFEAAGRQRGRGAPMDAALRKTPAGCSRRTSSSFGRTSSSRARSWTWALPGPRSEDVFCRLGMGSEQVQTVTCLLDALLMIGAGAGAGGLAHCVSWSLLNILSDFGGTLGKDGEGRERE